MRSRLQVAAVCLMLLSTAVSRGHTETRSTQAPVGLLLGLCDQDCETLWITTARGGWEIAARGKGIVTPRRDGFWRVGLSRPSDERTWYEWLLWAKPVGQRFAAIWGEWWDEDSVSELRHFGGTREVDLTFVGPEYVATREVFETYGPQMNYNHNWAVMSLDDLAKPHGYEQLWSGLAIGDVIDAEAARISAFAGRRALEETASQEDREMYEGLFLDVAPSSWTIERGRGRWIVEATSGHGSGAGRGYYFDYTVPVTLPSRVVGFDEQVIPWEEVIEEIPDATDAYVAPTKDVVIVRVPGSLLVCPRAPGGGIEPSTTRLPIAEPRWTVLVQWALGANVGRWTDKLLTVLRTSPPEPVPPPKRERPTGQPEPPPE